MLGAQNKTEGLAGIVAGRTTIAYVSDDTSGEHLMYRGYAIDDLCQHAQFEEVAYLLVYGQLPSQQEYAEYLKRLQAARALPESLKKVLELMPINAHPMDVLRTTSSFLGTIEAETQAHPILTIADRLLALFPGALAYWYRFHHFQERIDTRSDAASIAEYFLQLLTGQQPDVLAIHAMNVSLILYAEHDFNASTFAARVTTSTLSDYYSAITSAIGTLRGPLHGGANEAAMALIESFKTPADAKQGVLDMLARKEKLMGFGHRVYRTRDPRSDIIKVLAKECAQAANQNNLYEVADVIATVAWDEKRLFPNVDFFSAVVYHVCGIPTNMFTPIFVLSRVTGWTAHILEQRSENRLIRPLSEYVGPQVRAFVPLTQR